MVILFYPRPEIHFNMKITVTATAYLCTGLNWLIIMSSVEVLWTQGWTNERPAWCHLLFYFTYYALNMFRTLVYPSSGACDCVDELPHRSSCSQFVVCWSFCCGWYLVVFVLQASAWTENKTTDVVIHQHSRKLLKMDILMSETCWAHNKWNKIASDIKLVFRSSTTNHVSSIETSFNWYSAQNYNVVWAWMWQSSRRVIWELQT